MIPATAPPSVPEIRYLIARLLLALRLDDLSAPLLLEVLTISGLSQTIRLCPERQVIPPRAADPGARLGTTVAHCTGAFDEPARRRLDAVVSSVTKRARSGFWR